MSNFEIRHGEAVAIGVAIDTVYSSLVHGFPQQDLKRVLDCLVRTRAATEPSAARGNRHTVCRTGKSFASTWEDG